ncbi:hypothetical protein [Streptomyces sp. NPDC126933]|uniref:hypothetical protein n=1 Tax=unclassified Streptomyces TaxID=2593676 RepID=UPI00365E764D
MTLVVLLPLAVVLLACLLVFVLSLVYIWSSDRARRTRAWRLLHALLRAIKRDRTEGG